MARKPADEVYTAEQLQRLLQVKRALLNHAEGFNSITDWAKKRGLHPVSARNAVKLHCVLKQPVRLPREYREKVPYLFILRQLAQDTGIKDLFTTDF
jgi:hypothetical protein